MVGLYASKGLVYLLTPSGKHEYNIFGHDPGLKCCACEEWQQAI